jgi:hypothetical protein
MPASPSVACNACRRFKVRYEELCREGKNDVNLFLSSGAQLHLTDLKSISEQSAVLAQNWIKHITREHIAIGKVEN